MVGFDEALLRIMKIATPLGAHTVKLGEAEGCVLAADITARHTSPERPVSAMDGYAVCDADLQGERPTLSVHGESSAGDRDIRQLRPGTACRIFTGAPVPQGATRVVVQEKVARTGNGIAIAKPLDSALHIRASGSDFRAGDVLVQAGQRLHWRAMTVAAASDRDAVRVFRRPDIAILATGSELAPPGQAWSKAGSIPESVSHGIASLGRMHGARIVGSYWVQDDPAAAAATAGAALERADVLVVTGGASVGDKDYARRIFQSPLDYIFPCVAMKPGKPVWLARHGQKYVLGLPGNPSAALVTARLFLSPLLAGLGGGDAGTCVQFSSWRLSGPLPAGGERDCFVRARMDGTMAAPLRLQDSSSQSSLIDADLLIRIRPGAPPCVAGDACEALSF